MTSLQPYFGGTADNVLFSQHHDSRDTEMHADVLLSEPVSALRGQRSANSWRSGWSHWVTARRSSAQVCVCQVNEDSVEILNRWSVSLPANQKDRVVSMVTAWRQRHVAEMLCDSQVKWWRKSWETGCNLNRMCLWVERWELHMLHDLGKRPRVIARLEDFRKYLPVSMVTAPPQWRAQQPLRV